MSGPCPVYLAIGLASGALWFSLWAELMSPGQKPAYDFAAVGLVLSGAIKLFYWRMLDGGAHAATAESATGLGAFGKVRMLAAPHTEENYLMKEMGFRIARKHALNLRRIALFAGFVAPLIAVLAALLTPHVFDIGPAGAGSRLECDRHPHRTLAVLRRSEAHGDALLRGGTGVALHHPSPQPLSLKGRGARKSSLSP